MLLSAQPNDGTQRSQITSHMQQIFMPLGLTASIKEFINEEGKCAAADRKRQTMIPKLRLNSSYLLRWRCVPARSWAHAAHADRKVETEVEWTFLFTFFFISHLFC